MDVDLPVRILRENVLIRELLVGRNGISLPLEPGTYSITGIAPDGSDLLVYVFLRLGKSVSVPLRFEAASFEDGESSYPARAGLELQQTTARRTLYGFQEQYLFVEVEWNGRKLCHAAPVSPLRKAFFSQRNNASQPFLFEMDNPQANLLLRCWERLLLSPADAAVRSKIVDGAELLKTENKKADPVAAALAAYLLLRSNEATLLEPWVGKLAEYNPWLPDAQAIFGEFLARSGNHDEAIEYFRAASQGTPLFLDGICFILNRLSTYSRTRKQPELEELTRPLMELELANDFQTPLTVYCK